MCCFSAPTTVSSTRIFARMVRPGVQSLAYQMRYEAKTPTAMILPLPVALPAREASVQWKSLKEHAGFFDKLAAGFPREDPPTAGLPRSKGMAAAAAAPLEVHEVGDFIASFVPSIGDFDRVDARFAIRRDVWSHIPAYADYGFAVFQLKELAGTPHPMAFEFETRTPEEIFFPTVHIHDGTVHAEDHFDHLLYLQDQRLDGKVGSYAGPDKVEPTTGLVRSKDRASTFADMDSGMLDGLMLVHLKKVVGTSPNVDTRISMTGATSPAIVAGTGCGHCATAADEGTRPLAAAPAALAGLAWVIRRRDKLRQRG